MGLEHASCADTGAGICSEGCLKSHSVTDAKLLGTALIDRVGSSYYRVEIAALAGLTCLGMQVGTLDTFVSLSIALQICAQLERGLVTNGAWETAHVA